MTVALPDVLRRRAIEEPERIAYRFLDENGDETTILTYRALYDQALATAEQLNEACASGDRALLVFGHGQEFLVAFFGCLYARVIPVPVNPPRRDRVQEATRAIVVDCRPSAVLTTSSMRAALVPALSEIHPVRRWLAVDEIPAIPDAFEPEPTALDTLAFLQYTSGSTSTPKGVRVTHRNLVANQEMIRLGFGHDRDSTVVGWAPLFHDQGLIGNVLQPLYVGAPSILLAPSTFIRRPLLWLTSISRYRAHTSGGPNFAFDACVARAAAGTMPDLELSSWRVAFNGAEPIRAATLARFTETFAPHGFSNNSWYPCYGLAEATLLVTGSWPGRGPRTVDADADALRLRRYVHTEAGTNTLLGSGRVLPGQSLRLVDPYTRLPCDADRVGEIWVSGDHVAQGYWDNPEATERTFLARCADEPDRTYLRTGDLGLLVDDELYVVSRLKDVLIVRGRNYYPHDIEYTAAAAHSDLRAGGGAAFTVPGREADRVVLVQETRRDAVDIDRTEITGAIKAAVLREHGLSIAEVVLAPAGTLHKTSSGKIMRADARDRYSTTGSGSEPTPVDQPARQR
ncbi:fatty acyl-AMP ligase [Nocardia callitridis]|uniref:Uncharacterized protein n=1 Tax=Nocardia callitridis TaxID=648753 RepID=A0ABP9KME2_9NOCA